jgi:hypothetical protein
MAPEILDQILSYVLPTTIILNRFLWGPQHMRPKESLLAYRPLIYTSSALASATTFAFYTTVEFTYDVHFKLDANGLANWLDKMGVANIRLIRKLCIWIDASDFEVKQVFDILLLAQSRGMELKDLELEIIGTSEYVVRGFLFGEVLREKALQLKNVTLFSICFDESDEAMWDSGPLNADEWREIEELDDEMLHRRT